MSEQQYFYSASVADMSTKDGQVLPPFDNHPIQFLSTAEDAQGKFFALGYILDSEKGLFKDDKRRYMYETFSTTDGSNSTEDDVPNRLSILLKESPYNGIPVNDVRFGYLHVHRYIQPQGPQGSQAAQAQVHPNLMQGGKRKSRRGSRRSIARIRRRLRTYRKP